MRLLYDLAIRLMMLMFRLGALFHPKARQWVAGRRHWRRHLREGFEKKGKVVWVHAASLGEFEQGRPIIEAIREKCPGCQIVLTFFSPSGYEIRKNYPHADFIAYLPADTRGQARDFIERIRPDVAVFVKYEFWANYLFELRRRNIPTLLISALFRKQQPFFRWYGGLWRRMLNCFDHIYVQNRASAALLQDIGFARFTLAGDTRIDRVLQLAAEAKANPVVASFLSGERKGLIAGSTWPADEAVLLPLMRRPGLEALRWIIAPHEPSEKVLAGLLPALPRPFLRYSGVSAGEAAHLSSADVLVIDNIGMLNTLYRYGWVAYIGGGFGKGIHNTLEPAAFGLPVIFGPRYEKFEEARQFVARGGAFAVENSEGVARVLHHLMDPDNYRKASEAVKAYLEENRGATGIILDDLTGRLS